jgi:hypothetical protein
MSDLQSMDNIALEVGKITEQTRTILADLATMRESYVEKFKLLAELSRRNTEQEYLYRSVPEGERHAVGWMPMPPLYAIAISETDLRAVAAANNWMPN